jgi:hypothetical protein
MKEDLGAYDIELTKSCALDIRAVRIRRRSSCGLEL